jgi:hypothetical protein
MLNLKLANNLNESKLPNHEEHCKHSEQRYGVRGDDIHSWMDEPSRILGRSHRGERHDPVRDLPIVLRVFGEEYGEDVARQIFLDHLYLDNKERERTKIQNEPESSYPEPYQPSITYDSHSAFPTDVDGENLIRTIGSIVFGLIVLWALNAALGNPIGSWWTNSIVNPIGLWWSQNWVFVVGVVILIPVLLLTIYTFRNKNRLAKILWNLID